MQELIKALVKARMDFAPIVKNSTNPFHKSKYASLDAVLSAVTPALSANGLAVVQLVGVQDSRSVLQTRLYHESGEMIESVHPLPDVNDIQKMGAAITYARRYSICALLSVVADEDSDGQVQGSSVSTTPKAKKISQPQIARLMAIADENGFDVEQLKEIVRGMGFKSRADITVDKYDEIIEQLQSVQAQEVSA